MTSISRLSGKGDPESIRELLSKHDWVILAYLFGSVAKEGFSAHDIGLALRLEFNDNLGSIASLIGGISRMLNIPEDRVDIVDIGKANLPLKYKILTQGTKPIDKKGAESTLALDVRELSRL